MFERWRRTIDVLRAPRVQIEVYGGEEARAVCRAFNARHPRFKVTSAKRWGVALLRLPDTFEAYLRAGSRLVRRRRKSALDAGYRYAIVEPMPYLDDILEIHRSAPTRQGRPMNPKYLDRGYMVGTVGSRSTIDGILNAEGRLRAYAIVLDIGDAFTFSALIGHADDLDHGIMYLLMSDAIRKCVEARRPDGSPTWLVFDTFWGATTGLAYFKERTGFRPYTVRWRWVEHSVAESPAGT